MPKTIKIIDKSKTPSKATAARKKSPYKKADAAVGKFIRPTGSKKKPSSATTALVKSVDKKGAAAMVSRTSGKKKYTKTITKK